MKVTYEGDLNSVRIDIAGEDQAERALLSHLQEGHIALLCSGIHGYNGVRVFIREKADFEHRRQIADEFGRKKMLERRRKPTKAKTKKRK